MLNAAPTTITNIASFYPTAAPATNVQTAVEAGYTPSQFQALTPAQQSAALAQAYGTMTPSGGGVPLIEFSGAAPGGLITVGPSGASVSLTTQPQPTPQQVQAAVSAGLTPSQYAALTPAQRAALSRSTTSPSLVPILLIGGLVLVLMMRK